MNTKNFLKLAERQVRDYTVEHMDKTDEIAPFGVYVVWACKTLQNSKALLSTTISDGMYYEATYDGDRHKLYLDAYKKFENREIDVAVDEPDK